MDLRLRSECEKELLSILGVPEEVMEDKGKMEEEVAWRRGWLRMGQNVLGEEDSLLERVPEGRMEVKLGPMMMVRPGDKIQTGKVGKSIMSLVLLFLMLLLLLRVLLLLLQPLLQLASPVAAPVAAGCC